MLCLSGSTPYCSTGEAFFSSIMPASVLVLCGFSNGCWWWFGWAAGVGALNSMLSRPTTWGRCPSGENMASQAIAAKLWCLAETDHK